MARSKMIFKDIENCLSDLREEEKKADKRDKEYISNLKLKQKALKQVSDYVDSCNWLVKEDAKLKLRTIRASKYNYALVREQLNMTDDGMKSFMKYCIAKVKERIGENTVDLIMEGQIQIALVQFKTLIGELSLEKLLIPEAYENLPNEDFRPEVLYKCRKEIEFLYDFSQTKFEERLEGLNTENLAFLRYILEKNTPKFVKEKYDLVKILSGNSKESLDSYFERLEEESNYNPY